MKRLVIILLSIITQMICSVNDSKAQNALYALTDENDILRIDMFGCQSELIISGDELEMQPFFTDIAISQGDLYLCTSSYAYLVNTFTGDLELVDVGGPFGGSVNGMGANNSNQLYVAGGELTRIDLATNTKVLLGSLNGYNTIGDVSYREGSIFIAVSDSVGDRYLMRATENPFSTTIVCPLPNPVYGLEFGSLLGSDELYISNWTSVKILDTLTGAASNACQFVTNSDQIYGMAIGPGTLNLMKGGSLESVTVRYNSDVRSITIQSDVPISYSLANSSGVELESIDYVLQEEELSCSELPDGIYFLYIEASNGQQLREKIIIY